MFILEVLMRKVLTRCKIVLWYRFRQNENVKLLRCDFFALPSQTFSLTSFVKRFSKKFASNQVYFVIFRIENM